MAIDRHALRADLYRLQSHACGYCKRPMRQAEAALDALDRNGDADARGNWTLGHAECVIRRGDRNWLEYTTLLEAIREEQAA